MNVRRWFAYVPWILVTAANIVLDVVVTIKFASDAVVAMVSPSEHSTSRDWWF
jgi:hypothetical protein